MAQVARRSLAARRALLALALASALLLASLLMLRDEGDAATRAFRDGFTVAESVPRRTESDGSAAATAVVPDVQVAIAGAEQGGRSTTTIKTQDGHEITILHPEGKKQVTTISRDEGGKITIENVASDDVTRRPEELEQQDADARRGAEELEEQEEQEEDAADEAIIVSGAQQVKVTQLGRKVEVSTVEDAGDAR